MTKTTVFIDPDSRHLRMVSSVLEPSTEIGLVRDIVIREMAMYGSNMPRILIKQPKKNFHAGTRNGVPSKRRK